MSTRTPLEEKLDEIEGRYKHSVEGYHFRLDESEPPKFILSDSRGFSVNQNLVIGGFLESANDIPYLLKVLRLVLHIEHDAIRLLREKLEREG